MIVQFIVIVWHCCQLYRIRMAFYRRAWCTPFSALSVAQCLARLHPLRPSNEPNVRASWMCLCYIVLSFELQWTPRIHAQKHWIVLMGLSATHHISHWILGIRPGKQVAGEKRLCDLFFSLFFFAARALIVTSLKAMKQKQLKWTLIEQKPASFHI